MQVETIDGKKKVSYLIFILFQMLDEKILSKVDKSRSTGY